MAEGSLIAWTHNTFNPWIGCVKVSDVFGKG
jgi:protein gp37